MCAPPQTRLCKKLHHFRKSPFYWAGSGIVLPKEAMTALLSANITSKHCIPGHQICVVHPVCGIEYWQCCLLTIRHPYPVLNSYFNLIGNFTSILPFFSDDKIRKHWQNFLKTIHMQTPYRILPWTMLLQPALKICCDDTGTASSVFKFLKWCVFYGLTVYA